MKNYIVLLVAFFSFRLSADVIPGTIDLNFGTDGVIELADFSGVRDLSGQTPTVVLPTSDGSQYIAFSNGNIIKLTNQNVLDRSYGIEGFVFYQTPGGTSTMMFDGQNHMIAVGTYTSDYNLGWFARYQLGNSGQFDTNFNHVGLIHLVNFKINSVVQQSSGRYIVAGQNSLNGHMVLLAYTLDGILDTTFNAKGSDGQAGTTPGVFELNIVANIYAMIADEYDRLYVAIRNSFTGIISVVRLTSSGQIDTTFNAPAGMVDMLRGSYDQAQIRLSFDAFGNIVLAATTYLTIEPAESPSFYISVSSMNSDGQIVSPQFDFMLPDTPTLSSCIATSDGKILVAGSQENNAMWVAQITSDAGQYILDPTFNANLTSGDIAGIMQFSFDQSATASNLNSIAIYPGGDITMVGIQTDGTVNPFLSRAYDAIDITEQAICQNSKPIGTNDLTFGVLNPPVQGFEFLAITRNPALSGQTAQAIALQNDQTILVAIDGQLDPQDPQEPSLIFLNVFTTQGQLDEKFEGGFAPGQAIVLDSYQDQYVRDMIAIKTNDGVDKAVVTGYVTNAALSSNNLLLLQYLVTPQSPGLDESFGGYNGDPLGIVIGVGQSQGHTVGQQSTGRLIVCGYNPEAQLGLIQGYTQSGLLDETFGNGGYITQGSTGVFVSLIDSLDRIVIAYSDELGNLIVSRILADGSGLDTTFGIEGILFIGFNDEGFAPLSSNNSFKIVLDSDENLYVVAVLLNGTIIAVDKFDPNGIDCTASSSFDNSYFGGTLDNFSIGKLLINQDNHLVICGADATSILLIQIVQDNPDHLDFLWFDERFNAQDTPGYIRYNITDITQSTITDAVIHPDGRYILTGYKPFSF